MATHVLLVEPDFPYPSKSRNKANHVHRNFVPIGLLKLGSLYKSRGAKVKLVRGNASRAQLIGFKPSSILVTSLFTYWADHVWDTIAHYRSVFPEADIMVGGIYVTLHHATEPFKEKLRCYRAQYHTGLHRDAEQHYPDYSLLDGGVSHHITHTMRGCIRKCSFCGVWRIEAKIHNKACDALLREISAIGKNKVVFFDNNFLANRYIHDILPALATLQVNGKPVTFECQSGLDGRRLSHR